MIQDCVQFLKSFCAQHCDTCISEVRNSLEQRRGSQVSSYVEDASPFVKQGHTVFYFLSENVHSPLETQGRKFLAGLQEMFDFLENPGRPKLARPTMMASTP